MSSVSTRNNVDSSDDDSSFINFSISGTPIINVFEENIDAIDITIETLKTRVMPFIMSSILLIPLSDLRHVRQTLVNADSDDEPVIFEKTLYFDNRRLVQCHITIKNQDL